MNLSLSLNKVGSPAKGVTSPAYKTPTKKKDKNAFPTTPRSIEKQQKNLKAKLKRLMEQNLRLTATNRILKDQNKQLLDNAVVAEVKNQSAQVLVTKAKHEILFRNMSIEERHYFMSKLDDRVISQEKNVQGLVKYAKSLTGELESYKGKVVLAEKIVEDLKNTGNESVDSLMGMLKKYKRQQKYTVEEIDKLKKLSLIKDAEIVNITEELNSLLDYKSKQTDNANKKKDNARNMIEENKAIIKRQDKLIVDLQQKNEVCQIAITQTEDELHRKTKEKSELEIKVKELMDQRKDVGNHIQIMETKLSAYRTHCVQQQELEEQARIAADKEARALALAEKNANKRSPLKSNLRNKQVSGSNDRLSAKSR